MQLLEHNTLKLASYAQRRRGWWVVRLLLHTSFSSLPSSYTAHHPSTRQRCVQSHHVPCFCTATCCRPPSAACPVQTLRWQSHWRKMTPSSVVQSLGCWAQWRLLQNVFRGECAWSKFLFPWHGPGSTSDHFFFLPGKDEKQFPSDTAETFNSWQTHGKSSDTGRKLSTMRVQWKKGRIYRSKIIQTDTFSSMFTTIKISFLLLAKHKRVLPLESKGFTNTQALSFSTHHFYLHILAA